MQSVCQRFDRPKSQPIGGRSRFGWQTILTRLRNREKPLVLAALLSGRPHRAS